MRQSYHEYEVVVPSVVIPDHDTTIKRGDRFFSDGKGEIRLPSGRCLSLPGGSVGGMVKTGWVVRVQPPKRGSHSTAISLLENAIRR